MKKIYITPVLEELPVLSNNILAGSDGPTGGEKSSTEGEDADAKFGGLIDFDFAE